MLCQHTHQLNCLLQFLVALPSAAEDAPSPTATAAATRQNRQQDDEEEGDDEWKQPPELLDEVDDTLNKNKLVEGPSRNRLCYLRVRHTGR